MANVGALIPTPNGLGTVVQVLPGHVDPSLSQVVTLPIGGIGSDSLPPDYFGTLLPGQAQSAAAFVQTLILPSDGGSTDTAAASQATPAPQEASPAGASGSTLSNGNDSLSSQAVPVFAQATGAYQATQQRNGGETAQRPPMIG